MKRIAVLAVLLILLPTLSAAEFDFSKIKDNVSQFTLSNGLKFILVEDHSVPIVSFVTHVNVGSSDERTGIWGMSHFLEHMAFKGTSEVGTKNIKAERKIMARMDRIYENLRTEQDSLTPDKKKIEQLAAQLEELRKEAATYVEDNEYDYILKKNGAVGLNAGTGADSTRYYFSLPSNRLELWAALESSRFHDPVFREFYKEKDVIKEERRVRLENSPVGKLMEELLAAAFKSHPYRIMVIGLMDTISHISRPEMYDYFRANYTAKNMIIGVTGDVTPQRLKAVAEKYFSRLRPGRKAPMVFTRETPQKAEKNVTIYEESQPWLAMGYHCPSVRHEDFIKFSVLDMMFTTGRSSRLNKRMVIDEKSALGVFSFAGFPGNKYPSLYMIFALPNSGHTTAQMQEVVDQEIEKIKTGSVTEEELQSAKTRLKIREIRSMGSSRGLLFRLLEAESKLGSWEKAFDDLRAIEKITTDDIRELVKKYLVKDNRTIIRMEKQDEKNEKEENDVKEQKEEVKQ